MPNSAKRRCPMVLSTTETVSSGTRAILPGSLQKVWYSFQLGMSDLDRDGGD